MRNLTKAFLLASLIYLSLIALLIAAYFLFPKEEKLTKTKVDLSKLHIKKLKPKIETPKNPQPKITPKTPLIKPKEIASSLKNLRNKTDQKKMMSQAKIDSILEQAKKEVDVDPLLDAIHKKLPKSIEAKGSVDAKEDLIKELYGKDYTLLNSKAKKYLKDNYEVMHAVTQNVLNRIGRVYIDPKFYYYDYNLIEFTLYPDGSISDIKMLKNAGFELLNKITKETIETAFKDYPPTDEPILLRYKFLYDLRSF